MMLNRGGIANYWLIPFILTFGGGLIKRFNKSLFYGVCLRKAAIRRMSTPKTREVS